MKKFLPVAVLAGVAIVAGYVMASKPDQPTIGEYLSEDEMSFFEVLNVAIDRAELRDILSDESERYTLLAPHDGAFVRSFGVDSEEAAIEIISQYDQAELKQILLGHVVEGNRKANSLLNAQQYSVLSGEKLTKDRLHAAGVVAKDWDMGNGYIHAIDNVLLPEPEAVE